MEKIIALIDKLQELKNNGAALSDLAYFTQMLYAELMCAKNKPEYKEQASKKKVAVIMPGQANLAMGSYGQLSGELPVRKEPVEARMPEPELVQAGFELFEPLAERDGNTVVGAPAARQHLRHRETVPGRELNEVMAENAVSLNDRLKKENIELASRLTASVPVGDLTKAMGINDRFLFINELFRGDRNMFDRSVKTINECGTLAEAEYWIGRELKIKLGWQDSDDAVQQFYHLVSKRFS